MEVLRLVGGGATDVTDAEVLSLWYHLGQHALLGGFGLGRRLGLALLPVASFWARAWPWQSSFSEP